MKITYTVGARAGLTAEVDAETGAWMVSKRRAVEVPAPTEPPVEGTSEPRVKRKYVRKAPTEGGSKGTEAP